MTAPNQWFLPFANPSGSADPNLAGLPWGAGTEYASRAAASNPVPYDDGNRVEPLIGGYWAMSEIRDALVSCLDIARAQDKPLGQNGLVYIAGWRLNPLRDLSVDNSWGTGPWMGGPKPIPTASLRDETILGEVPVGFLLLGKLFVGHGDEHGC